MEIRDIIAAVVSAAVSVPMGMFGCSLLNKIPAKWLCDYDEEPSQELLSGVRFKMKPYGVIMGVVLAVLSAALMLTNMLTLRSVLGVILFWTLVLIAAADIKYQIIPDQFTVAAAVVCVAYAVTDVIADNVFSDKWYDPLIGLAVGGGILMIMDLFSFAVLKKEGFGFGDIKLLAALGILFGWKYIIVVMVMASLVAAVHFLILIFKHNGKMDEGSYLPMAPYLCLGAMITLVCLPWLEKLFDLYATVLSMTYLP